MWWVIFTGRYKGLGQRPATLSEELLWRELQNARRVLVELGVG